MRRPIETTRISGNYSLSDGCLVWKILHEGIRYIELGTEAEPKLLIYRAQSLAKQLRKFGYSVQITPANRAPA